VTNNNVESDWLLDLFSLKFTTATDYSYLEHFSTRRAALRLSSLELLLI
jgi:hypothetical protein